MLTHSTNYFSSEIYRYKVDINRNLALTLTFSLTLEPP